MPLLSTQDNDIDIVVTDILMPEKDGLELMMALREKGSASKIIAMSGSNPANNYLKHAKLVLEQKKPCKNRFSWKFLPRPLTGYWVKRTIKYRTCWIADETPYRHSCLG